QPQEHPDDRPHRLRQDRDQPPPRQAGRRAVREGRGDQVHRGRLCRPRRGTDRARSGRGGGPPGKGTPPRRGEGQGGGRGDGPAARRAGRQGRQPGDPRQLPPAVRRGTSGRQGSRAGAATGAADAVRAARRGRIGRHDQPVGDDGQGVRRRPEAAPQAAGPRRVGKAGRGGSRQAPRPGRGQPRRVAGCRGKRHRLPRRDRQDRGQRRSRRLGQPRGGAARPAAADRGDDRCDQIRPDEDRPYPLHRLGRVPRRQA
ncbi:hypothetical protein LTR94_029462, partial [Friedmanniomyces endolithicus]